MPERLSFYIRRSSSIHRLNPLTKIALLFVLIVMAFFSPWYWTAPVMILAVVVPLSHIARIQREYLSLAGKLLLPAVGFIFVMQALFLPGAEQLLFRVWIVRLYQENVAAAFLISMRIIVMISSFMIFLMTTHPSELMSDLTRRRMPGTFAYVIISTLQILPQMQAKALTIIAAQQARGLDTKGGFFKRVQSLVPLVGPLVFGSLAEAEERAIAIEARGFSSPLPKTSLHEVPDTSLDKLLRRIFLILILLTLGVKLWLS